MIENVGCSAESRFDSRFTLKGTTAAYGPDRTFDTEHIRLNLDLNIGSRSVSGTCTTRLRAITRASSMSFDAVGLKIKSVKWNGRKASFEVKPEKIIVTAPRPANEGSRVEVEIAYEMRNPKLGMYFIKPSKAYPRRPTQVWTQGEDEYSRYWFPCHDAPHDRTSTEIIVRVPKGFTAISNGKLVRRSDRGGRTEFHWLQEIPHATYLVTLAAGRFTELRETWRKTPVLYYCEKGREDDTRRAFGKTPKMLEFFSTRIGTPYPFAKYAQVAATDFIYGGMENTSATTQTDTALLDERSALDYSSDELVAHELAHQWLGDYLTCKDWSHAWLNESFATYFDPLFKRFDKGEDEYLYHMRGNMEAYFQEDKDHYRRPIVTKMFRRPTDMFDRHLYEKGSVVLYMLHHQLGETLFWKAIRTYVRDNKGATVETADLINAIEDATGRNPRRFFDQWVFGGGHPEFKVRSWWDPRRRELNVRVVQTQAQNAETGLFTVPAEFLFLTSKGERRQTMTVDEKSHLFKFPLPDEPTLVLFDPDHRILKKVDFPKTEKMLMVQLRRDRNVLGRIDAAQALGRIGSRAAISALRDALLKDDFWGVRSEVAQALGQTRTEEAATLLIHALDVIEHPKVRRAIYSALANFPAKTVGVEAEKRWASEKSYFAQAAAIRLLGAVRHPRAADAFNKALKTDSWNDVTRIAAIDGAAATNGRDHIATFLTYTKAGHHQRLRMAAIRALAQVGAGDEAVQNRLIQLAGDDFLLVRISAVRALQQIGDERAVPALKKLTEGHLDGRLKRLAEEAIEKIMKGVE